MTDDNIIGIDGQQVVELRKDQAKQRAARGNTPTKIEMRRA
jgi:hypothetical protein